MAAGAPFPMSADTPAESSHDPAPADQMIGRLLEELHTSEIARRAAQIDAERAQDLTMKVVATALQDDVEQVLLAVATILRGLRVKYQAANDSDADVRTLVRTEEQLARAGSRLQRLILEVRPPSLERHGLAATLRTFLSGVQDESGLQFELVNELHHEPPVETQINLYRIAYEAIDNVRKYARATKITVEVREYAGGFMVRVTDDGQGFDQNAVARQDQLGFQTMSQRAEVRDGWWQAQSEVGQGTTVEVWTPGAAEPQDTSRIGAPVEAVVD